MASARKLPSSYNTSTYGNGTRDYTALNTWEAATDNDLVTATAGEVLECYDDSTSFNDGTTMSGSTTSSSYFRVIKPAAGQGHDGTPNNGITFIKGSTGYVCFINEANSQVQDIIGQVNLNSALSYFTFKADGSNSAIVGCISFDIQDVGAGVPTHFGAATTSGTSFVIDCLAVGGTSTNGGFRLGATGGTAVAYNCTAYNPGSTCFIRSGGTAVAKNCLAGSADGFSGTFSSSNNNASTDGTAPGTSSRTSQTFTFVDTGTSDIHLSTSDAGAKNFGADLSADGTYAFDDDIDGDSFITWDIGIDEPEPTVAKSGSESTGVGISTVSLLLAITTVSETFGLSLAEAASIVSSVVVTSSEPLGVSELVGVVATLLTNESTPIGSGEVVGVRVNVAVGD